MPFPVGLGFSQPQTCCRATFGAGLPAPDLFLCLQRDPKLAKDLENELEVALKDGSFDNYFYNSKEVKDVLERADLPHRRAFYITNPLLPKTTPLDRKELWITIDDLKARAASRQ